MKNLIITMGILSLMSMGILYETDCMRLILFQRQLERICNEMAEAAVCSLEKEGNWAAAEKAAEEILRRNMDEADCEFPVWNAEATGNTVTVKVSVPPPDFRLSFLERLTNLSAYAEKEILSES